MDLIRKSFYNCYKSSFIFCLDLKKNVYINWILGKYLSTVTVTFLINFLIP